MLRSQRLAFALACCVPALFAPVAAHADIIPVSGSFIVPTHFNGFEAIGPHGGNSPAPVWTGPYTEGGITVEHIGGNKIVTTEQHDGQFSWYDGSGDGGYTRITMADHGPMDAFQFDATTQLIQPIDAGYPFYYELLLEGQVVKTGSFGALCDTQVVCFNTYGFKGGLFDEVHLQANIFLSAFDGGSQHPDVLLLDNLYAREVPEPASWALMIVGLGAAGGVLRRRHQRTVVSFA